MYGGGLWHTWYDRVLGLGGRVVIRDKDSKLVNITYECQKPIAKISTLAIHLKNTSVDLKIKKENDLKPIIATELLKNLYCSEDGECSGLLKFLKDELKLSSVD